MKIPLRMTDAEFNLLLDVVRAGATESYVPVFPVIEHTANGRELLHCLEELGAVTTIVRDSTLFVKMAHKITNRLTPTAGELTEKTKMITKRQLGDESTCFGCGFIMHDNQEVCVNDEVYRGLVVFFCSEACVREFKERHASGCICADCAGAELTAEND